METSANTCLAKGFINVSYSPKIDINFGRDKEICPGQTAELTPTILPAGLPLTYTWSTGDSTLKVTVAKAGAYELTVKNGSCTTKASTTVHYDIPKIKGEETVCLSTATVLLESGAIGKGLSYFWSPANSTDSTVRVSRPGPYTVAVTSQSGCQVARTITVLEGPKVELGGDKVFCEGETIALTPLVNGQGTLTYGWSTGETTKVIHPRKTGSYKVTVHQSTCQTSDSIHVTINPLPKIKPDESICLEKTIDAGGLEGNLTYEWTGTGDTKPVIEITQ